jgi:hypothetical protein
MKTTLTTQNIRAVLLIVAPLILVSTANATFIRGQPFIPTGADFSISAAQGIDSSNPNGQSGFSPKVNGDFEFKDSIGVSYDQGGGKLKDFGIGLYQDSAKNVESTGLLVQYNQPVSAFSVTITIEDFDIKPGDAFFKTGKVEPIITLFGPGGTVFASLSPTAIFNAMTLNTSNSNSKSTDVWDLNFGKVLSGMNLADGPITGFLLYADSKNGEKTTSDPYLLVTIGSSIPFIPEASNYMVGAFAVLVLAISNLTILRRKKATA